MRCELTDHEWTAMRPTPPNKPRGGPQVRGCLQWHLPGVAIQSSREWRARGGGVAADPRRAGSGQRSETHSAVRLEPSTLRVGDVIRIRGHTTDFRQKVESPQVDHAPATEVGPKDDFGLKLIDHAREHDVAHRVR